MNFTQIKIGERRVFCTAEARGEMAGAGESSQRNNACHTASLGPRDQRFHPSAVAHFHREIETPDWTSFEFSFSTEEKNLGFPPSPPSGGWNGFIFCRGWAELGEGGTRGLERHFSLRDRKRVSPPPHTRAPISPSSPQSDLSISEWRAYKTR